MIIKKNYKKFNYLFKNSKLICKKHNIQFFCEVYKEITKNYNYSLFS